MSYLDIARRARVGGPASAAAIETAIAPSAPALHPCVVCHAEAGPGALFCSPCWTVRLERSPRLCDHRLYAWDPERRAVMCATCRHELHRDGPRFVLAPQVKP